MPSVVWEVHGGETVGLFAIEAEARSALEKLDEGFMFQRKPLNWENDLFFGLLYGTRVLA